MTTTQVAPNERISTPEARWATALFCEMIRFEQDGKVTLVGVHPGAKIRIERQTTPNEVPTILNFAVAVKLRFPKGDMTKPAKVTMTPPGGPAVVVNLPSEAALPPNVARPENLILLGTHLLQVHQPGLIEAVVELEDGYRIYAGALEVEFAVAQATDRSKESEGAKRSKRGKKKDKST
jgi:hypothetical protein